MQMYQVNIDLVAILIIFWMQKIRSQNWWDMNSFYFNFFCSLQFPLFLRTELMNVKHINI